MFGSENIISAAFRQLSAEGSAPVILQVIPALHSGGVEQGVIDMSAAIVKAGGKSIVVSSGGNRVYDIIRGGGEHVVMPVDSKNPFVMWANVARLRHLIKSRKVNLVHPASRAPAWSAAKAVEGTSAKLVTSCHSAHKVSGKLKRFYNSAIVKGERIIAISDFIAGYLKRNYEFDESRLRVVHRGIPLERFHPTAVSPERLIAVSRQMRVPEGVSVIMLPARLSRIKGHVFLLDAIAKLKRKDIFCLFVGSDRGNENYRIELERHIALNNLGAQCRIVGECNDIPAAYMLATVVVCPSLVPEGFGRTAVEAQAMGKPVIATDHGGAQETIIPNETGWLVNVGDVTGLAAALEEALSLDANARALLATRTMAHIADNFTIERMAAATLDVYAEVLGVDMQRAQAQPLKEAV